MIVSGIYKIQSGLYPERCYLGSTNNYKKRKKDHLYGLRSSTHGNRILQNHYNKHGVGDLVFMIIETCPPEDLLIREQYYIDTLSPYFNICKKANSTEGRKCLPETIEKLRIAATGVICSEETRMKMSNSNVRYWLGRKLPKDACQKMSRKAKERIGELNPFYGKTHSDESKKKMGESKKGTDPWNKGKKNVYSEETRISMGEDKRGIKLSDEVRKKMSEAKKGRKFSAETKQKIKEGKLGDKNPFYGKCHTDEVKKKISEGLRKYHKSLIKQS